MTEAVNAARAVAAGVLRRWAPVVDRESRFPHESVGALRQAGLMAYFVPTALGGLGDDLPAFCAICAALGEECLSTAVIWGMHCQQVAVLAASDFADRGRVLSEVVHDGALVASVTTEPGTGGDLLRPATPVGDEGEAVRIARDAPVVSYGEQARWFLLTVREGECGALALVHRDEGRIRAAGGWDAMGMRGTRSVPMRFDVRIGRGRVLAGAFRDLVVTTMIPIGHLAWASAWYGAARGAFRRTVHHLRVGAAANPGKGLSSESLRSRLARLRLELNLVEAMIDSTTARIAALRARGAPPAEYGDPTLSIRVNDLKIASSEGSFRVVDGLMDVCGLFDGYLNDGALGLERVFRDLRSGPLMYGNERLRQVNGSLLLVEGTRLQEVW